MKHYTGAAPATRQPADWRLRAACLGKWSAMHPENDEAEIEAAKRICGPCPVKVDCFFDAVHTGDMAHGIRAGLRPNERRAVAKELEGRKQPGQAVSSQAVPEEPPKKREPAQCGTRAGYRRHRAAGEDACGPCRQANTDADNRLRRTGTSKAAA
ncbi:WhiB family transcriptional regulator [Streptomyces sp. NPDC051987]|uniref:WhiB family transcriptional regulator n=1 Tax=Streptomyces sp. NPDC051987 TaxID=3155808 RepID=UPI0034420C0C